MIATLLATLVEQTTYGQKQLIGFAIIGLLVLWAVLKSDKSPLTLIAAVAALVFFARGIGS